MNSPHLIVIFLGQFRFDNNYCLCLGQLDIDNNSRLITQYVIIISGVHYICKRTTHIANILESVAINIFSWIGNN